MKNRLLFILCVGALSFVSAQTVESPWRVAVSVNAVDIYPVGGTPSRLFPEGAQGDFFDDFTNVSEHWSIGGPTFTVERYLKGSLSLGAMMSVNNITKFEENTDSFEYPYLSVDGYLKFNPFGGKFISPFLLAGYGMSTIQFANPDDANALLLSRNASKHYFGGVGLEFKLGDAVGLSLQSNFKNAFELDGVRHFQHQVGVSYHFGSGDRDKDGVSDKKDKCPDVAGLKEFEGCPDTDEDGIPDNKDGCPEEPGTAEMNGCPDTDGDGVPDKDDLCPEVAGAADMEGCPDTDGDGFHDGVDECPDKAAPDTENGCPAKDTDGDGVPDTEDACPEQAGTAESNGCPEVSDAVVSTMNGYGAMINFMANSDRILGKKMFDVLEKIKTLITENPGAIFLIEGYASSDGDVAANQALSVKRAESVRNTLIQMGVDESRLEVVGYGVEKPIDTNETAEGRAKNRRVQFRKKQ